MDNSNRLNVLKEEVLVAIHHLDPTISSGKDDSRSSGRSVQTRQGVYDSYATKHSGALQEISTAATALASEGRATETWQKLLRSLRFKEIDDRYDVIDEAHTKTLSWAFNETTPDGRINIHFIDWLRYENGFYWIAGKPGSGKSTLMRYLSDHYKTKVELSQWAAEARLVTARFFFWNTGSRLQNSRQGLLQALLFEILRRYPELISSVCTRWQEAALYQDVHDFWNWAELKKSFENLREVMMLEKSSIRFCFFIDGLDEHEGEPRDLIALLKELATLPCVKFCISSRPWNVFEDAFGGGANRVLRLEDLTREDIRLYVTSEFETEFRFKQLRESDVRYDELAEDIIWRAKGVFLWVHLVVKDLLEGFTNADKICDLKRRLDETPETLEGVLRRIFYSVGSTYHTKMARTLQTALIARRPLSLMTFFYLNEGDLDSAYLIDNHAISRQQIDQIYDETRRQLHGQCKGLLEVVKQTEPKGYFDEWRVEFFHQSAKDFLQEESMQLELKRRLKDDFNPFLALCKTFVCQLKTISPEQDPYRDDQVHKIANVLVQYALPLETYEAAKTCGILDEAEKALDDVTYSWSSKAKFFLCEAVQGGLVRYVEHRFSTYPESVNTSPLPLLAYALYHSFLPPPEKTKMVELMLEWGADPNETTRSSKITCWTEYLSELWTRRTLPEPNKQKRINYTGEKNQLDVVNLLRFGADLDAKTEISRFPYEDNIRVGSKDTALQQYDAKSALEILHCLYPDENWTWVANLERKDRMPKYIIPALRTSLWKQCGWDRF